MTTQQPESLSSDAEKPTRSRDSSPNTEMPRSISMTMKPAAPEIGQASNRPPQPLHRRDTSESMQPEFCDDEISISVPPMKQVNFKKACNVV